MPAPRKPQDHLAKKASPVYEMTIGGITFELPLFQDIILDGDAGAFLDAIEDASETGKLRLFSSAIKTVGEKVTGFYDAIRRVSVSEMISLCGEWSEYTPEGYEPLGK